MFLSFYYHVIISCITFFQDLWMYVVPTAEKLGVSPKWIRIQSAIDGSVCSIGPGPRAKHSMAWIGSSLLLYGGQINIIKGATKAFSFAGDTWLMNDGCPAGYHTTNGNGCQICPIGSYASNRSRLKPYECSSCPPDLTTKRAGQAIIEECNKCSNNGSGICVARCGGSPKTCNALWTCNPWAYGKHCMKSCPGNIMNPDNNDKTNLMFACSNHGNCNDKGNCTCDKSFAGTACNISCGTHSVDDGSTHTRHTCRCEIGYTGEACDISCHGGFKKGPIIDGKCECPNTFYGVHCKHECLHGGKSKNYVYNATGEDGCICPFSYVGSTNCDQAIGLFMVFFFFLIFVVFSFVLYRIRKKETREVLKDLEIERKKYALEVNLLVNSRRIDENDLCWDKKIAEGSFGKANSRSVEIEPNQYNLH